MRGDRSMTERILNVLRPYASNWTGTLGRGDLVIPQREIPRVIHEILDALRDETADIEASEHELFDVLMAARRSPSVQDQVQRCCAASASCSASAPWELTRCAARRRSPGSGVTPQGKVYGTNAVGFAVDAVRLALDDAGLDRADVDGLLVNPGLTWNDQGMGSFQLQQALGLRDLRLTATMNLGGATACAMIQHADAGHRRRDSVTPSPASSPTRR